MLAAPPHFVHQRVQFIFRKCL